MKARRAYKQFEPNIQKTLEAMLFVLEHREQVNMYNLLKVLFEADKFHLNTYARPVTGDVYVKMEHGTVASAAYDMLKFDEYLLKHTSGDEYPFRRQGNLIQGLRKADCDLLSRSDTEALSIGMTKYLDIPFKEVERLNHLEKCWLGIKRLGQLIPLELMIENEDVRTYFEENPLKIVI